MYPLAQILSPIFSQLNQFQAESLSDNDRRVIERFIEKKHAFLKGMLPFEELNVSKEIADSWLRSQANHIGPSAFKRAPHLTNKAFEALLHKKSLLIEVSAPYFYQMESLIVQSDCMLILSDENGVILNTVYGQQSKTKELMDSTFFMFPGVLWNESTVGTCAHGLTLIHKRPFQILGAEHYNDDSFGQTICSSAPIFNQAGQLEGTLSLSSPFMRGQSLQSLGFVVAMAKAVEKDMQVILARDLVSTTVNMREDAVIITDHSGTIVEMNSAAQRMLRQINGTSLSIFDLFGEQPEFRQAVDSGAVFHDILTTGRGQYSKPVRVSIHPIKDRYQETRGLLLVIAKAGAKKTAVMSKKESIVKPQGYTFEGIIGQSPRLQSSVNMARKFSKLAGDILVQGESGTGKEVFAQSIHNESRPNRPFIAVNCAAIPNSLIWSEMFGYDKGSFTGADKEGKPGKIELANGGTLFLDEIGDMPHDLQAVLLRVLEDKTITRVGSGKVIPVDFRLITATNRDLLQMIEENTFREDLYYRLAVYKLIIPPLRNRDWDIILLAEHFLKHIASNGGQGLILSDEAKYILLQYDWPGNVRQLKNAILYAAGICQKGTIKKVDLPEEIVQKVVGDSPRNNENNVNFEQYMIAKALEQTHHQVNEAARILNMGRSTLYRKIKQYGLNS